MMITVWLHSFTWSEIPFEPKWYRNLGNIIGLGLVIMWVWSTRIR